MDLASTSTTVSSNECKYDPPVIEDPEFSVFLWIVLPLAITALLVFAAAVAVLALKIYGPKLFARKEDAGSSIMSESGNIAANEDPIPVESSPAEPNNQQP